MLQIGQYAHAPVGAVFDTDLTPGAAAARSVGKPLEGIMVGMHGQANLLEVVAALHPPCSFASSLDGRQQQTNQNADDCNHDQQFNQGKSAFKFNTRHVKKSYRGWAQMVLLVM